MPDAYRTGALCAVFLAFHCCPAYSETSCSTSDVQPASSPSDARRAFLPLAEEEDWSFLANSKACGDFLDSLKYIQLGKHGAYVSIGGEARFYFQSIHNESFGRTVGDNSFPEFRLLLHGDINFTPHLRFFFETQSSGESGRKGGARPGVDRDNLGFVEAFFEARTLRRKELLRAPAFALRIGRQQLDFGAGRLVSARGSPSGEGPNVLQGFDGVRLIARTGLWRVDAFAAIPNDPKLGVLQDGWLTKQSIWGAYLSHGALTKTQSTGVDAYYIGAARPNAAFFVGVAPETRHSVGVRVFRASTPLAYDAEAVYQFGSFGARTIRAWGVTAESTYTFRERRWSPQPGIRVGVNSGGWSASALDTFYPPFPRGVYFGNLTAIGPENTTGIEGALTLHPSKTVTMTGGAFVFWRKNLGDGLYSLPGYPLLSPLNHERSTGVQPVSLVTWKATRNLSMSAAYERFERGDFIRSLPQTRSMAYVAAWAVFRF